MRMKPANTSSFNAQTYGIANKIWSARTAGE